MNRYAMTAECLHGMHAACVGENACELMINAEAKAAGLDIGRRLKARRIAEAIRSLGGGAHDARQMSDSDWMNATKIAAQQTGRGFPKRGEPWHVSDVTRALVIELLSQPQAPEMPECPARDEDCPA